MQIQPLPTPAGCILPLLQPLWWQVGPADGHSVKSLVSSWFKHLVARVIIQCECSCSSLFFAITLCTLVRFLSPSGAKTKGWQAGKVSLLTGELELVSPSTCRKTDHRSRKATLSVCWSICVPTLSYLLDLWHRKLSLDGFTATRKSPSGNTHCNFSSFFSY